MAAPLRAALSCRTDFFVLFPKSAGILYHIREKFGGWRYNMKKRFSALTLAICCVAASLLTLTAARLLLPSGGTALERKIASVESVIKSGYIGETDWQAVEDGAAAAMVQSLGDRWSYYMTAESYEAYKHRLSNTTDGIGVTIQQDEASGGFLIISVSAGSPAEEAGLEVGQIIVSAAGQDVRGLEVSGLREIITAAEGEFEVTVLDDNGAELSFTLHRETIFSSPVSSELREDGIGYIRIANFEGGAADGAKAAIDELTQQGARALIFDVRANPGGQLKEMIALLDYILPEGDIFISVGKDGKETVYTSDSASIDLPMAVLIDENSYSAAEFFAAALREYDKAVLVGMPSTGKGRSQVTYELYDGSAVHISTARYLTPGRIDLSEQGGLIPDLEVPLDGETDTQLQEAAKYLS